MPDAASDRAALSLRAATAWLVDQQLPDGGFPGPSGASDPETTIDAVLALHAADFRVTWSDVMRDARSYLVERAPEYAVLGSGQAAKMAMAAIALNDDPWVFGGEDPVYCDNIDGTGGVDLFAFMSGPSATPTSGPIPGISGRDLRDHALVLITTGTWYGQTPRSALEPLRTTQAAAGGWAIDGSIDPAAADARTTSLVIQALAVAQTDPWEEGIELVGSMQDRGLEFFRSVQTADGGFASSQSEPHVADAISTAMAVQAISAVYDDPASPEWGNALGALARFQTASGGFRLLLSDEEPSVAATLAAIPAMAQKPLPVAYVCFME